MEPQYKPPPLSKTQQSFNLFAGVIVPAISITIEATTHICAETYFDPISSVWYLMLVIFVPNRVIVEEGTEPTTSGPEAVALLAVVFVLLSWLIYRSRRFGRGGRGCPI